MTVAGEVFAAHQFATVDEAADPQAFVRYLDRLEAATDLRELKRSTYRALRLEAGDRVLDVGCGTGQDVRSMAQIVGPTGLAVGLDRSATFIDAARARADDAEIGCRFIVGAADRLPFEDASFDAARADRVLQYVEDVDRAVAEMIRVVRPGGRLLCFEPDWDLHTFDSSEPDLTNVICRFRSARMGSGGAGHQLRGCFVRGGLVDIQVSVLPGIITDLRIADSMMVLRGTLEEAVRAGVVTSEDATRWWTEQEAANEEGRFLTATVAFLVSAQKPQAES